MKKIMYKPVIVLLLFLFMGNGCSKDDTAPIDQLPPATQTGENTFGCLVNGKAFLPKGSALSGPILSAFYQFVDGGYYFGVTAKNKDMFVSGITVAVNNIELEENTTYTLLELQEGNAWAGGFIAPDYRYTSAENTGELHITKLDQINNIVSGTFWFDIIDDDGKIVEIREGRFDMHYVN